MSKQTKQHQMPITMQDYLKWSGNQAPDVELAERAMQKLVEDPTVQDFIGHLRTIIFSLRFREISHYYERPHSYEGKLYCDALKDLENRLDEYQPKPKGSVS